MNTQKPRILIVEDDRVLSLVEARMVEQLGYTVSGTATTGEQAIEEVERCKPDVILMDIKLGGPMNGFATMSRIRETNQIPVIYVTGHLTKESHQRAEQMGCAGYLVKPIRTEDLEEVLDEIFQAPAAYQDEKKVSSYS